MSAFPLKYTDSTSFHFTFNFLQTTVAGLKRVLEEKTNIPQERQRLIYRGRVLENSSTLAENSLETGHTIHMVERSPEVAEPPPETTGQQGGTRIHVNMGTGVNPDGQTLQRLVQGVLNAVGVRANVPNASSAPPNATNANPQGQPTTATGPSLVENVPHLLLTFGNYLSRMETGGVPTRTIPLFSLAPPQDASRAITPEQMLPLTSALCQILSGVSLDDELRTQLETARQSLASSGDAAVESTTAASGASVPFRTENNTVRIQRAPNVSPAARFGPPDHYPHLPLLLNAFANVVQRTERLIREKASRSLNNALRSFQPVTEVDESNLELLIGGLLQIGSISHWYAALLTELGRIAAALIPALNGNLFPLALNTASVISHEASMPNFQPLLPRGLAEGRNVATRRTMPIPGANMQPIGELSVSVERSGTQDGTNQTGSVVGELTAVIVEGTAPMETTPAVPMTNMEPPQSTTSENQRTPAGMGTGLRPRPRSQDSTRRTSNEQEMNQESDRAPPVGSEARPEGLESIMRSVGAMFGGEGGLGTVLSNLASNPNIHRLVDNPAMQQIVGEMMQPESIGQNLGRLVNEVSPALSSMLGSMESSSQNRPVVSLRELQPDRAAAWTRIMEQDVQSMSSMSTNAASPLSAVYLTGRVTRSSNSQILRGDLASIDGESTTDDE
eukprot:g2584.t1